MQGPATETGASRDEAKLGDIDSPAMQRDTDPALTLLPSGAMLTLTRGAGQGIAVFAGLLWVTEAGGRKDHFLTAGDTLLLQGEDRIVAQAIGATQLLVFDAMGATATCCSAKA